MKEASLKSGMLEILLVFSEMDRLQKVSHLIESHFNRHINTTVFHNLLEAIEHLEISKKPYSLIVFQHLSASQSIVKTLVEMGGSSAFILCGRSLDVIRGLKDTEVPIEFVSIDTMFEEIPKVVNRLEVTGKIPMLEEAESDYISIRPDYLPSMGPLEATVYTQLIDGHYVPVFGKGDSVERKQVEDYLQGKKLTHFYFKREDCKELLHQKSNDLKSIIEEKPLDRVRAEEAVSSSLEMVRDVVGQMGFTPEAQKVAINSVSATIKLMGTKPRLSGILLELKNKDGDYLTAHSLMLGKVACAMAYKIGWTSRTTYFKLTLASFLHDIALNDGKLAVVNSIEKAAASGEFSADEIKEIRLHATKAADYARSMSEVPSDVEQIVLQHHERPDGSGFPRGLPFRLFTPLSALFVIAQDLIDYSQRHKDAEVSLETFFDARETVYSSGIFKKIFQSLRTDSALV
jgi:hypothetical protein